MEIKKKKNNSAEFDVEKCLTAILTEGQKREIILERIKSNTGSIMGMFDYLVKKFHNEQVVNLLSSEILMAEILEFRSLSFIKVIVKTDAMELSFEKRHINNLMDMNPREALMYLQGFKRAKKNKDKRNYLTFEDEAFKNYYRLIKQVLEGKTKYKVVKDFVMAHPNLKTTEPSYSKSFDSFLDNHSEEIKTHFELTHIEFYKIFFPRRKVK